MPQLLVNVLNPLPSDDYQFGGDWGNRVNDIHHGVATDEDIQINTEFKFYSGMLSMYDDDPARSHKVTLKVENIGTGNNKSITIRDPTIQDDFMVTEGQSQTIYNKILGNNVSFAANPDFNGVHLLEAVIDGTESTLQNIPNSALNQITDKAKLNSNVVYTDQANVYGAFNQTYRSGYLRITNPANTFNYSIVGGALTGSYNVSLPVISAHDTFALLGITNTFTSWQKISFNGGANLSIYRPINTQWEMTGVAFNLNTSTGAESNYAALYGQIWSNVNGAQNGGFNFRAVRSGTLAQVATINYSGQLGLYNSNNFAAVFDPVNLTAERFFTFPNIGGRIAVETNANIFTDRQRIQYNGQDALALFRDTSNVGIATGFYFRLRDSANNDRLYATLLGGIGSGASDNVAGAENGQMFIQLKVAGTDTTKVNITNNKFYAYGMVPDFTVGSGDLNSMYIYRPVNSSGSNLINFQLQDVNSNKTTFGYVGIRSETVTDGAEVGSVQLGALESGTLQLQAKVHSYKTYLYNNLGNALIIDPTGLSSSRTITFPDANGQVTLTAVSQTLSNKTLTSPIINAGALNGIFTASSRLDIVKTAEAGGAEQILRLSVSDDGTSYIQFDNATTGVNSFYPRLTAVNTHSSANAVGMYQYFNIVPGADTADNFNAVAIFDARQSDSTPIEFKRLFQFRNNAVNVFEIYVDKFDFSSKRLTNAVVNLDEVTIKHSTTNTAGDIPFFDGTRYNRKPQGSNNQFLGVVGGVLGYYTPTGVNGVLALAGLTDDVNISNLQDNQIIRYDLASGKWQNEDLNTVAGLVSNIGGGHEVFKQLAATNELRTLVEGMGIDLTQNADTITIALGSTVTIPTSVDTLSFIKTIGSGEKIVSFGVSDDVNSSMIFENGTGVAGAFVPQMRWTNGTNNNFAGIFLVQCDPLQDTGTTPLFCLDTRVVGGPLTTRPMMRLQTYGSVKHEWAIDSYDMKNTTLKNAVIDSTVTGIKSVNIANDAAIPISKINVAGGLASTTSAGFVELAANGESGANLAVQASDDRLSDARVPTSHANSHQFGQADALSLAFSSGFDYLIFKSGSTYYLKNNKTGTLTSNAAPDSIFQAALTAGGSIYVFEGDYTFTASGSVVLSMPVSPVYAELYMSPNTNLIVPQGYTGVLLQFRHAAVGTAGVTRCKVYGGNMKEAGTRQELWTAIQFYGDAGVSVAGMYWNVIESVQIYYPKKGIHLLNASGGTKCFFNQNIFRNIIIWYPKDDGVHFDMQNAYIASTNGFHRNRFEYITIQGAGRTTNPNATVGFRDIRHTDNTFIGCYPVDFTGDSASSTIHADAIATVILGGTMDALNHTNASGSTIKATQNGRITTNGINPSNGNNLDTFMGAGQTTLTWSFWNTDISERFYFQKSNIDYRFDFVRQSSGGALRPVLFRQYDVVTPSLVESFRIETDATLQVAPSKFVLKDTGNAQKITFNPNDQTADRIISIPVMAASDNMVLEATQATLSSKTIQGLKTTVSAKTAAYTALQTDDFIPCDATSAAFTVTLPAAASSSGRVIKIQKTDSSANAITIDGNASETINGSLTMLLTAQYQVVELHCNGTAWLTTPYSVVRRGKSTATGNGSATSFNVPHGLGVDPHDAIITCRTHTNFTYTTNSTNIVVTFAAAPANGASVIFDWSAVP